MKRFVLWAALIGVCHVALGATRYVTDDLSINMRTGKGNQYTITKVLSSGTPVQIERSDESNGYTLVGAPDGKKGWVLTRFLDDQPSARDRLSGVLDQLSKLKQKNSQLQQRAQSLQASSQKLQSAQSGLSSHNQALQQRIQKITSTAANSLQLAKQNKTLKSRVAALKNDKMRLRYENKALQSRREGLKIGALILIAGVIVGVILPRFRVRRRRSGWDD